MKSLIIITALLAAFSANATNNQNNSPQGGDGGNGYGGSGYGVGVGVGIAGAESNASAKSSSESNANAAAIQGQGQQQGQIATGGDSKATAYGGKGGEANAAGGAGGSATGGVSNAAGGTSSAIGGSSGGNSINVQGSTYEQAASTAYAPDGKAPRTSCRLFVGLGGTSQNGSLSGGIPIGNDQTCMSGAQIEAMDKANKVQAGTFLIGDYLLAICKMEGMDQTQGCKK